MTSASRTEATQDIFALIRIKKRKRRIASFWRTYYFRNAKRDSLERRLLMTDVLQLAYYD